MGLAKAVLTMVVVEMVNEVGLWIRLLLGLVPLRWVCSDVSQLFMKSNIVTMSQ